MINDGPKIGEYDNQEDLRLGEPGRWIPHTLVGGMSGSGKSNMVKAMIKKLIFSDFDIYGIDLKGGRALKWFNPRLNMLATTGSQATALVMQIEAIMKQRIDSDTEKFPGILLAIDG